MRARANDAHSLSPQHSPSYLGPAIAAPLRSSVGRRLTAARQNRVLYPPGRPVPGRPGQDVRVRDNLDPSPWGDGAFWRVVAGHHSGRAGAAPRLRRAVWTDGGADGGDAHGAHDV